MIGHYDAVKLRSVVVVAALLGATAVTYFVWNSSHDEECVNSWNYQVGSGEETPEAALEAFGVDPRRVELTDSTQTDRTFVDGSRTITVSQVDPGWAVVTDSKVTRC